MKNGILLLVLCLAWNGCDFTGGGTTGGSETTNGLTGIIHDGEGKPVVHAAVVLLPETYNPIPGKDPRPLLRTVTDNTGAYRFGAINAGVYNLEAKDSVRHILGLIPSIEIDTGVHAAMQVDGILAPGGSLEMPFSDRHLPENAVLYFPGTTYYAFANTKMNSENKLVLTALAAGNYPNLVAASNDFDGDGSISIAKEILIKSGEKTEFASLQAWSHSLSLKVDLSSLSAGGAGEKIAGYPLLVRLNSGNFDFTTARTGGEDIRFSKIDGTALPYQIEDWNAAEKSAVVWVRMDSVSLSAMDTSIVMHWGRVDAMDASQAGAVFDSSLGLTAAWHLNETANTTAGGYMDAGWAGLNATASAPNINSRVGAIAGYGKSFGTTGGILKSDLPAGMNGNGSFSVTFWMKYEMMPNRAGILTFGTPTKFRGIHFLIRTDTTAQFGPWDMTPDSVDTPSAQQNHFSLAPYYRKWVFVATVYDAGKGSLTTYINGEVQAVNSLPPLDILATPGLYLGRGVAPDAQPQSNYSGLLDEVRLYHRPLTESWIQLEYATQKENSLVVTPL